MPVLLAPRDRDVTGAVFTGVPIPNLPVATKSPAVVKLSDVES